MLQVHQSANGSSKLISQMDDCHLANKLIQEFRKLIDMIEHINKVAVNDRILTDVYGVQSPDEKYTEAIADYKSKLTGLYPYMAEWGFRNRFFGDSDIFTPNSVSVNSLEEFNRLWELALSRSGRIE